MRANDAFYYQDGQLYAESVSVNSLADRFGTPLYIYAQSALVKPFQQYDSALENIPHVICYAVKANSNLTILKIFSDLGAGFDIVSGGELSRVLAVGADPKKIAFSGVGKSRTEIGQALHAGIGCFNVESLSEFERIEAIASAIGYVAPIACRVNPNVDPKTHPYISTGLEKNKFGVDRETALEIYKRAHASKWCDIQGISCHIGSQLLDDSPLLEAMDKLLEIVDTLQGMGVTVPHIDIGGGIGIQYRDEKTPSIEAYCDALKQKLAGRPQALWLEPGRSLVGNAGILVTQVEYLKKTAKKAFVVVDAAMNDLMRPALYDAWHTIEPVLLTDEAPFTCDVVGPICETGDFFARDRELFAEPDDRLAIFSAGAYGASMASNYNSRPRAVEVLVNGDDVKLIRPRETVESLFKKELELLS